MSLLLLALLAAAQPAPAPTAAPPVVRTLPPVVRAPAPPIAAAPSIPAPGETGPRRAAAMVPLHRLVNVNDYPAAALRAGEQGVVEVALDIAPEGRVTACTIAASSGSAILDASTCRILRSRARFTPALDAAGKPVPDRIMTRIAWRMPAAPPPVPPAVHAAMSAWAECIGPAIGKGVGNRALSARAVAEQAFAPCVAAEDRMLAVIRQAVSAARPLEEDRAALRGQVVDRIEAARKAKQP